MPVSRNARLGTLGAIALAGALGAAQADFAVSEIEARFAERALQLSGALDLTLTPKVEEALAKGIPLDVVIGVRLLRVRAWLWDERAGSWTVKRRIRYHALSGQYLVSAADANPEINESYTVLGEALKQLGVFDRLQLPLPEAPLPDARYQVQVRAHLDLESLPTPLQPVAYTSLAWHLNSGWSLWQVAR